MNDGGERERKERVNPLWLVPTAVTLAALYQEVFEFGHLLAEVARKWLSLWREIWQRLFELLSPLVHIELSADHLDNLTLWIVLAACLGVVPTLLGQNHRQTTAETIAQWTRWPDLPVYAASGAVSLIAITLLVSPFAPANARMTGLPDDPAMWMFSMGYTVAGALFLLGALKWGSRGHAETQEAYSKGMLLISFICVLVVLAMPAGTSIWFFSQGELMDLANMTLLVSIAIRSTLPIVQISLLLLGIFAVDSVTAFLEDAWLSVT